MLASFLDLLHDCGKRRAALGAFTCYNFETAFGVLQAASALRTGVVILISEKSFASADGASLVVALRAIAARALVPVCLQLDHVSDLTQIETAFALGVGAVMADGAHLAFADNVGLVRAAVAIARKHGGHIEAELGRIEGDEDVATAAAAGALTDPNAAVDFVNLVAPACLGVSIGNVHGVYRHPPALDWERLTQIRARTDAPLSLHGASGLADADLHRAIALGIIKINVNTELRVRYLDTTAEHLERARAGARVMELNGAVADAISEIVAAKLRTYEHRDDTAPA